MVDQPTAESASLADRIAAKFGIDADEPQEQPAGQAEEASANTDEPDVEETQEAEDQPVQESEGYEEVDVDGEVYKVPPKLKDAVLRQADYTRKTQVLAEAQRQVQSQAQQIQMQKLFEERSKPISSELQKVEAQLEQYKALDWSSMDTDTIVRARQAMDGLKEKSSDLRQQLNSEFGQFTQAISQSRAEALQKGMEYLRRSIPRFDQEVVGRIRQNALSEGFTDGEVESIADPRFVKVLWKASQYDALQAGKQSAQAAVKKAPPVIRPGASNPMPTEVKQNLAYRKAIKTAKNSQEKAKLIEQRLGNMFK